MGREVTERPCKKCGKKIVIAQDIATGKTVPLDAQAPVWRIDHSGTCRKAEGHYVSHFSTCAGMKDGPKQEQKLKQMEIG